MNKSNLIDAFVKSPNSRFNISSKLRREILLSNNSTVTHNATVYEIKFKNMGGGIYETYLEKKI